MPKTQRKSWARYTTLVPPFATTYGQLKFIKTLSSEGDRSSVLRNAIDALESNPNVEFKGNGDSFDVRIPAFRITEQQDAFLAEQARRKGVSRSQVLRNAVKALAIQMKGE